MRGEQLKASGLTAEGLLMTGQFGLTLLITCSRQSGSGFGYELAHTPERMLLFHLKISPYLRMAFLNHRIALRI